VALEPPPRSDSGLMLWTGGPVDPHRGFLLLAQEPGEGDSERIAEGFHLTASVEVLRRLLEAEPAKAAEERARLLLGYAGWGSGQLLEEILRNDWLIAPLRKDLLFSPDPDGTWAAAVSSVGINPEALPLWLPGAEQGPVA